MRFQIAGTIHPDPLCRHRLRAPPVESSRTSSQGPAFIAVEAKFDAFEKIRVQRTSFKELARGPWPDISDDLACELALTLLYEADTHLGVFPDAQTIYLDDDRTLTAAEFDGLTTYAKNRMDDYAAWYGTRVPPSDAKTALEQLDFKARYLVNDDQTTLGEKD